MLNNTARHLQLHQSSPSIPPPSSLTRVPRHARVLSATASGLSDALWLCGMVSPTGKIRPLSSDKPRAAACTAHEFLCTKTVCPSTQVVYLSTSPSFNLSVYPSSVSSPAASIYLPVCACLPAVTCLSIDLFMCLPIYPIYPILYTRRCIHLKLLERHQISQCRPPLLGWTCKVYMYTAQYMVGPAGQRRSHPPGQVLRSVAGLGRDLSWPTSLPVCWSALSPVACRLSPVARGLWCTVCTTDGMSCPARPLPSPLLCSSLPFVSSGRVRSRPRTSIAGAEFVQIRSQWRTHAGGHWQSNTTPVTHRGAIATTATLFVIRASISLARVHACGSSIRGPGVGDSR